MIKLQIKLILSRHAGRYSAITSRELARLTGEPERRVRLVIRELIAEGLPVASATEQPAGYFIVTRRQEAEDYALSIKRRLIEDALRRRDFRRAASLYLKPAKQGVLL